MSRRLESFAATAILIWSVPAFPVMADVCEGGITCVNQPTAAYLSSTTLIPLGGLTDGMAYPSVSDGNLTVSFSSFNDTMVRLTVPSSWATWNCPPATETACTLPMAPNLPVLWSGLFKRSPISSVTLSFNKPVTTFGLEIQPDSSDVSPITMILFDAKGDNVGGLMRNVSGNAGALLFAASSTTPITEIQLNDEDFKDFAIANLRYSVPEPTSVPGLGLCIALFVLWLIRRGRITKQSRTENNHRSPVWVNGPFMPSDRDGSESCTMPTWRP